MLKDYHAIRSAASKAGKAAMKRKFTWLERQEWEKMELRILDAEAEVGALQSRIDDPVVLKNHAKLRELCAQLEAARFQVESLYARWSQLESLQPPG